MKPGIIYAAFTGIVYATSIALIDFFNNEEFELTKFIFGIIIFGIAMIIAAKINNKKDK